MIPHHLYYQLVIVGLLGLCVMLHYVWPSQDAVSPQPHRAPAVEAQAVQGAQTLCGAYPTTALRSVRIRDQPSRAAASKTPAPMAPPTRRPRVIDTAMHFCPHAGCDYQGWLGLGNLRANGHPSGGPWR